MRGRLCLAVVATALAPAALLSGAATAAGPSSTQLLSRPTGLGPLAPAGDNDALATRDAQSDDGRFVVFESKADDLGPRDGLTHVYRRDTTTGETILIDRTALGTPGDGDATQPVISGDGSTVCFTSMASNLVPGVAPITPPSFFNAHILVARPAAGTLVAADRASGAGGVLGTKGATDCLIDTTGAHVAFTSDAANLVAGDTNGNFDTFVRDVGAQATTRVSLSDTDAQSPGGGFGVGISGNGARVSFTTRQPLVAGETGTSFDVYVRDTGTGTTIRGTLGTGGVAPNGDSGGGALSDDGNEIVFFSDADNLAPGDGNNVQDVFVRFIGADETVLVSKGTGALGTIGNSHSSDPAISGNGLAVGFTSQATNLGAGAPPPSFGRFAYVRNLSTNELEAVSRASGAAGAPAAIEDFSAVGVTATTVSFTAAGAGLDPESSADFGEVFQRQRAGGRATTMASRPTGSGPRDSSVNAAALRDGAISADGRFVAFTSGADGLFPSAGAVQQAFVRDTVTGTTTLVSRAAGNGPAADLGVLGGSAVVSADGTSVAFVSQATNLVSGVTARNVYVRDLVTGELRIASRGDGPEGGPLAGQALPFPARIGISADGTRVVFTATTALAPADTNTRADVYVRDLVANTTTLASVTTSGGTATVDAGDAALSLDGRHVAFVSGGQGFVDGGPTDGGDHLYVRDLAAKTTVLADRREGTGAPIGLANSPGLSADGGRVVFRSLAQATDDPVPAGQHVYVRDLAGGHTILAGRDDGPAGAAAEIDFDGIPAISGDGRRVTFTGFGIAGAPDAAHQQVFRRELDTSRTVLVSAADGGALSPLNSAAGTSAPNADGDCVAFAATGTGLASPDFATVDFSAVYLRTIAGQCPRPAAVTAQAVPPAAADRTAPVLSRVSLTNRAFRVGRGVTALSARARTKVGTTLRYTLSEAATVTITVTRSLPGRRVGRRCVAATRRLRKRARCTRTITVATLRRASRTGANRIAFSGRFSKRRVLAAAAYGMTLRGRDAAGNLSRTRRVTFRVVRR